MQGSHAASLWKIINCSIPTKERPTQCYSQHPEHIANEFNQFFVAVGGKTTNAAAQVALNNNLDVTISNSNPAILREHTSHERFHLSPVSCTDIKRIIMSMALTKLV